MRLGTRSSIALAAGLVVLLATLAILQYRWTIAISRADEDRVRLSINESAGRFADDLDREVSRAFATFRPSGFDLGDEPLGAHWSRWLATAPHPRMVRDLYRWRDEAGMPEGILERFDPSSEGLVEVLWPPELDPVRARIAGIEPPGAAPAGPLIPEIPALVVPDARVPRGPFENGPGPNRGSIVIVVFDPDWIAGQMLPELASRHFDRGDLAFHVVVRSIPRSRVIYESAAAVPSGSRPAVVRDVFAIRHFPELREAGPGPRGMFRAQQRRPFGSIGPLPGSSRTPGVASPMPLAPNPDPRGPEQAFRSPAAWRLEISSPRGPLGDVIAVARWRNLALSFGILALLGASILVLMTSLRHEHRIARQQIEFVAGVTHELNTPLAAIRAAGQNLADGIVRDDEQVRRYGSMIASDRRRLASLVDDILAFAGLSSQQRAPKGDPVDLRRILEDAVHDQAPLASEAATSIDMSIPASLPPVRGDADALRRAFGNLIANAIRHGGSRAPVELRAELNGSEIRVIVRDHGPGIPRSDIPYIFEPFWRGSTATGQQIRGTGLGLSIVRRILDAHGAHIAVRSSEGQGTELVVTMPGVTGDAGERHEPGVT